MHLLGNDRNDGGTGYKGETIPEGGFVDKVIMSVIVDDLKKVMVVVPIRQHDKAWQRCVESLHRMTTENSNGPLTKSIVRTCMSVVLALCNHLLRSLQRIHGMKTPLLLRTWRLKI